MLGQELAKCWGYLTDRQQQQNVFLVIKKTTKNSDGMKKMYVKTIITALKKEAHDKERNEKKRQIYSLKRVCGLDCVMYVHTHAYECTYKCTHMNDGLFCDMHPVHVNQIEKHDNRSR